MTQTSFRDVEQLSALLDEKLDPANVARLQNRLKIEPELRAVYNDLRETRFLLNQLPQRRAPRNFTLKPSAARVRPPLPRSFPVFRLASALASILLFFSLATNAALPRLIAMANSAPMYAYGMGGGGGAEELADSSAAKAAPESEPAAALEAPAAPAPAPEELPRMLPEATSEPLGEPTLQAETLPPLAQEAQPSMLEPQLPEPSPAPELLAPPIPTWTVILLAILAIASGAVAFFSRWQSDQRWKINTASKK